MKEIILLKAGEIALKGLNRSTFEERLVKNCKFKLKPIGSFKFTRAQSTMVAEPLEDDIDMDDAVDALKTVFGFAGLSRACVVEKDLEKIQAAAAEYLEDDLRRARTFKVEAKRADKAFPLKSPEICYEVGGYLLSRFPHLRVDVHNPDMTVYVEVRDFAAYVRGPQMEGAGGMPVSSSGKAMLLVSGGIDSPVAGYMMAKRGLEIEAIHFAAPPYTSEHAKQKVISLCQEVGRYAGRIKLHVVGFTRVQEEIRDKCPEEFFTIIMRRYMMKIAERLARQNGCGALITGESVAQVASQTLYALGCTDVACELPVLRPVIGMDKNEIIAISRRIGTFETSILPYEDCCTVFTPRHPRTKPKLHQVLAAERGLDEEALIAGAMENIETIMAHPDRSF
ncbi:MAG: tRNA 4-thiouridine(8) synthase ThiI [Clostridiales bacterium]|nr:tRNA 4-thiouridine(8) synthase ThiI [Clostridiales bacterium]